MPPIPQILKDLTIDRRLDTQHFSAQLLLEDARQTIRQVRQSGFLADAVFLDPFSPPRCPQLWTIEFIAQVASCIQPTGRLATYSCSAAVQAALLTAPLPQLWTIEFIAQIASCIQPTGRLATYSCSAAVQAALLTAGLQIGATPRVARQSPGTIASYRTRRYPNKSRNTCLPVPRFPTAIPASLTRRSTFSNVAIKSSSSASLNPRFAGKSDGCKQHSFDSYC